MSVYVKLIVNLVSLQLIWINREVFAGTCNEAQLCCNGRDSSCVVQKTPINAIIEDLNDKPCYCDHACLKLGDCCVDFKDHCGVLDCQVSEWGTWSDCDTNCGTGMMSRSRKILQTPQNGGKHCPSLVQKRGCQGYRCHEHKNKKILREMALLLPAALSKNRHANDSIDIRKNLRSRYSDSYKHNREHEYCVEFEVVKASKACHKLPPYNKMLEGDRVSAQCDLEALIQDNSSNSYSNSASSSSSSSSSSNRNHHFNSTNTNEITNNSAIQDDEHDDEQKELLLEKEKNHQRNRSTTKGNKIKYRCRGEGLAGHTTRWSALAAPSCRGKWLRLTLSQPKKCSHSQFIFV